LLAGQTQSPQSSDALEKLCRAYWQPLYFFIRRQGHSPEDAQDLTQQFFARLLERNDFLTVDPRKGKFRTFLLTSLCHFLSNERDRSQAAKRGGGRKLISLDELASGESYQPEPASLLSPDKLFDQRWATVVLEQALQRLRAEMAQDGKSNQFDLLKAYLTDEPGPGDYAGVAQRLGATNQAVAVAVHRLRHRYRELVRAEVAQTVTSPQQLEEELRHLAEALNG
jgi:RNA polymerase sigma-70 factor (ECF subfamily)